MMGSNFLTPQPPFRGPFAPGPPPRLSLHISPLIMNDYYDFRFVSEVLDDAESVADTFESDQTWLSQTYSNIQHQTGYLGINR